MPLSPLGCTLAFATSGEGEENLKLKSVNRRLSRTITLRHGNNDQNKKNRKKLNNTASLTISRHIN